MTKWSDKSYSEKLVEANVFFDCDRYHDMIGMRVTKKHNTNTKEPKPFKSGKKINTVKGVIVHPELNIPAFIFEEDDSYVECRRCYKVIE